MSLPDNALGLLIWVAIIDGILMNFQLTPEQGTKVLVNGVAKSGTHLLKKVVALAGYQQHPFCLGAAHANRAVVSFSTENTELLGPGIEIGAADPTHIHELLLRQLIRAMPPGFVFNGHCAFDPALAQLLSEEKVRIIGILRDPRDIALSLVRYLIKHKHPVVQERSEEQLLHAVLDGLMLTPEPRVKPSANRSLSASCEAFLPWMEYPNTLTVRFEDLVGDRGGGDKDVQLAAIQCVLAFLGKDRGKAEQIRDQAFGGTRTFSGGQIGGWQSTFSQEHGEKAQAVFGDYLQKTGY